jgi:hypothetical protein
MCTACNNNTDNDNDNNVIDLLTMREGLRKALGAPLFFVSDEYGPQEGSMREVYGFGHYVIKVNRSERKDRDFNYQEVENWERVKSMGIAQHFASAELIEVNGYSLVMMERVTPYTVRTEQCDWCSGNGQIDAHSCDCQYCDEHDYEECIECEGTGSKSFFYNAVGNYVSLDDEMKALRQVTQDWPQGGISHKDGQWKWYDYQPW